MPSRNLLCPVFVFELYSFVIKIAMEVNRAVLLVNTISTLGLSIAKADFFIVKSDPTKFSVIINSNLFLSEFFYCF